MSYGMTYVFNMHLERSLLVEIVDSTYITPDIYELKTERYSKRSANVARDSNVLSTSKSYKTRGPYS
jgi:hypothetical protein